jgi:hypothetical protein
MNPRAASGGLRLAPHSPAIEPVIGPITGSLL